MKKYFLKTLLILLFTTIFTDIQCPSKWPDQTEIIHESTKIRSENNIHQKGFLGS